MKFLNGKISTINAAALLLGAAGLLSRFLGVARDRLLFEHFGASRQLDMYVVAFQIPDFFYTLFLLGASSAAIIPIFLSLHEENESEAGEFIADLLRLFFMISVVIAFVVVVIAPYLVRWIAPGFTPDEQAQVTVLTRIMMLSPVLLGLSSILSAVLQSFRRFLAYALSAVLYNVGIIFGIVIFLPRFGLKGVAFGVVLGATMHMLVQAPAFWNLGFAFLSGHSGKFWRFGEGIQKIIRISFPRFLVMSLNQITLVVVIALASRLSTGSISIFQYAYNLYYLPIGVFGVNFGIAAFPTMSEYFARKRLQDFYNVLIETIHSVLFWVLPISALLYVLRAHIVRVAYGTGKLNWQNTRLIAASVGIFAIAIITESLEPLLVRAFYALNKTRKPLIMTGIGCLVTIILAFGFLTLVGPETKPAQIFFGILRVGDLDERRVLGIVLSVVLGSMITIFLMLKSLLGELHVLENQESPLNRPEHSYNGTVLHPVGEILKMAVAAMLGGLGGFGILRVVNLWISQTTFLGVLAQGAIASVFGALVYGIVLYFWGSPEIERLIALIKRKMFRPDVLPEEVE